jgi:hypothetical protein
LVCNIQDFFSALALMGFAFDRVSLVHAFEIRRAKAPDSELVAALNPSYRLAGLTPDTTIRYLRGGLQ